MKNKGYALILNNPQQDKTPNKLTGHWKSEELDAVKAGVREFGCDWLRIAQTIPSRSWSQVVRKGKVRLDEERRTESWKEGWKVGAKRQQHTSNHLT